MKICNKNAVLALTLLLAQIFILLILLMNVLKENFFIGRKYTMINSGIYTVVTASLVVFSIVSVKNAH